ncbi:MAG TPA: hypothetical protein VGF67_26400 [Ktedonobacteraceae bacterium]|jgi:hypothetical protein
MEFNIHQQVFDDDGEYSEKLWRRYRDQLVDLFDASPEAQILQNEEIDSNWTGMLLDYAIDYLGVTPPQMTSSHLRELLFDLVPRKISAPAQEAPEIIRETQLFWTFLEREFHLDNAKSCLKILDERAVHQLRAEMSDASNFGFAKSFVMQGMERGFDMSKQEDLDEWMQVYNAEQAHKTHLPFALPEPFSMEPVAIAEHSHTGGRKTSSEKTRRKMARNSRKQNRKR